MRSRILALVVGLVLVAGSSACAQELVSFGAFGGVTSSRHIFDETNFFSRHTNPRFGPNMGIYFEWIEHSSFSTVTQLLYSRKGTEIDTLDGSARAGLDIISFNVLAKARHIENEWTFYLVGGPRFDFKVEDNVDEYLVEAYDDISNTAIGVTVGTGIQFPLFGSTFFTEVRFNQDLTSSDSEFYGAAFQNQTVDLSLGIDFEL